MEALISEAWYQQQSTLSLLVLTAASLAILGKGADWLVEGASDLALRMGMSKIIVGATIVSLGTTTPECAVSVFAAWHGDAGLALGNAVGSVIADSALIFGLGCVLVPLPANRFVLTRQGWVQFGSAILLAAICYGAYAVQGDAASIGRPVGVMLLVLLGCYLAISVHWSRGHALQERLSATDHPVEPADQETELPERTVGNLLLWIGLGLVLVIAGSHVLIDSVEQIALRLGVSDHIISATLVAFGTSLPELVIGITSLRKGHAALLVGNVIGADILNILFVTGAAAVAAPLPLIAQRGWPEVFLALHLPSMLAILTYFRICIHYAVKTGTFRRWMGVPLLVAYVVFMTVQFFL